MVDPKRVSGWAGVASVVLTNLAILGATLASPSFTWAENALSDLGQPGTPEATPVTTLLFDGGLVIGGVVGLGFAYILWAESDNLVERLAAVSLVVTMAGMAGVGVFPLSKPLHTPAAMTFYLGSMVTMGVYGVGNVLGGAVRRGAATIGLVAAHVGVWWWWVTDGSSVLPGLAVPEFVGALIFSGWVLATAKWRLAAGQRRERAGSDRPTEANS